MNESLGKIIRFGPTWIEVLALGKSEEEPRGEVEREQQGKWTLERLSHQSFIEI